MAVANSWSFVFASPTNQREPISRIEEAKVTTKLNAAGSVEVLVPLSTRAGQALNSSGWGYVLVFRNGSIFMVAETTAVTVQAASSGGVPSVAVVAVESAYERLNTVFLSTSTGLPVPFPPNNSTQLLQAINAKVADYNSEGVPGLDPLGVRSAASVPASSVVPSSSFDSGISLLALIQAYAFRASGFDFWIDPTPYRIPDTLPASGFDPQALVGQLVFSTLRGSVRPEAAFGYGPNTRANLSDYKWARLGGDHLANSVFIPSSGTSGSNAKGAATASSVDSWKTYGSRRRWITSDLDEFNLRKQLADEHILYRSEPRRILTITPQNDDGSGSVPTAFADYDLGDIVPARIVETLEDGSSLDVVSGSVRIYGITATISKDGVESIETETSPENV